MAELIAGPIMKWVGGKTQMLDDIKQRMPKKFNKYIEPLRDVKNVREKCLTDLLILLNITSRQEKIMIRPFMLFVSSLMKQVLLYSM